MFEEHIPAIEKVIGHTFRDKSLLRQAFTRSSYVNEGSHFKEGQSNEVLEFFGDGVLSCAVISLLIRAYGERGESGIRTQKNEGEFSNIKAHLCDKANLSRSMEKLDLAKFLRMGEGDKNLGIYRQPSVMEDLFESIIGAVYLDSDMQMGPVMTVVDRILSVGAYLHSAESTQQSPKNALQEFCANKRRRLPPPVYTVVSMSGPDHERTYEVACTVGERVLSVGRGIGAKNAEIAAASAALAVLQKEYAQSTQTSERAPTDSDASRLYEYAQKCHLASPVFRDLGAAADATPQYPKFHASVTLWDGKTYQAEADSKAAAKQAAAAIALRDLP